MGGERAGPERPQLEVMIEGVFAPAAVPGSDPGLLAVRDRWRADVEGDGEVPPGRTRSTPRSSRWRSDGGRSARRAGLAHAGRRQELHDGVLREQAAPRSRGLQTRRSSRVTDRTDLDNQLLRHVHAARTWRPPASRRQEIAGGPDSLHALLKRPGGRHRVHDDPEVRAGHRRTRQMPVLSERENIVVMADEAHRSQYASFAENITVALPNATRIGFTGTPVEKADRSTRLVFGDYVSIYRMRQAQEDHATVPIYYESRQIPLDIADPEQLAEVEEVLEERGAGGGEQAGDGVGEAREGRRRT